MNERYRLPFVALVALQWSASSCSRGRSCSLGSSAKERTADSSPSLTPTATPAPTPTEPALDTGRATRAFFEAFNKGWLTDDPTMVKPYVTSTDSSAYLSVSSFLGGEKAVHRAAVITTRSSTT